MPGKEVYIKKMGNAVVLLPIENTWDPLIASLDMFSDDFMNERNQPAQQKRRRVFR